MVCHFDLYHSLLSTLGIIYVENVCFHSTLLGGGHKNFCLDLGGQHFSCMKLRGGQETNNTLSKISSAPPPTINNDWSLRMLPFTSRNCLNLPVNIYALYLLKSQTLIPLLPCFPVRKKLGHSREIPGIFLGLNPGFPGKFKSRGNE